MLGVAAAAAVILVIVGVRQCPPEWEHFMKLQESAQNVVLEIDYFENTAGATLDYPNTNESVESLYAAAGIRVQRLVAKHATRPLVDLGLLDPGNCTRLGSINGILAQTRDQRILRAEDWYAHGAIVPACCDDEPCGMRGMLWFGGEGAPKVREKFVILESGQGPEDAMLLVVHELAHVLNLHHCELRITEVGTKLNQLARGIPVVRPLFEATTLEHLRGHLGQRFEHVAPGAQGDEFCGGSVIFEPHDDLHDRIGSSCLTSVCDSYDRLTPSGPQGVKLAIRTERERYAAGEPYRLSVQLAVDPNLDPARRPTFLTERSLDPIYGFLRLWRVVDGRSDEIRPLVWAESEFSPQPLESAVGVEGLELWFHLPVDLSGKVTVIATYQGFGDAALVAQAQTQFDIDPVDPAQSAAYELFTAPVTRRFLFFKGGAHLQRGKENLELLARQFPGTVYGRYAAQALLVSHSRSFLDFDPTNDRLTLTEARPDVALSYAPLVRETDDLPPSYYRQTIDAAIRSLELKGDRMRASDPGGAREQYAMALSSLPVLTEIPHASALTKQQELERLERLALQLVTKRDNVD